MGHFKSKQVASHMQKRRRPLRRLLLICGAVILVLAIITFFIRRDYQAALRPVSNNPKIKLVDIKSGETSTQIAKQLYADKLIRHAWTFEWYVHSQQVRSKLEAGTYALRPNESLPQIVSKLITGRVASKLVTILPGQRLDQVQQTLINAGFTPQEVASALNPANYAGNPALADKPAPNSLEGFLYPDSFAKTSSTTATQIVTESIDEMGQHLTPGLQQAFAAEGLSTYQGIILASIVGQEVSSPSDQAQAAQVFLSRLKLGMNLGSDVTAYYGSILAGQAPSLSYDSPYNTLLHPGLPPTPISNVTAQELNAVAHPAPTHWLYFVSGDNGVTYFSQTLQQQQQNTAQYCHKLCNSAG